MALHHRACERSPRHHRDHRDAHRRDRERVRPRRQDGDEDEERRDRKRRHRSSSRHRGGEPEAALAVRKEEASGPDEEKARQRRRVIEWQKKRREQLLHQDAGSDAGSDRKRPGKKWTLDSEEESDEEERGGMDVDLPIADGGASTEEDERDPLDAFMNSMVLPDIANGDQKAPEKKAAGRIMQFDDDLDSDYSEQEVGPEDREGDEELMKKTKADKLATVDHSTIDYPLFRKSFYIESPEMAKMSSEEAAAYSKQLELKVHGKDVPKPIKSWVQSGLTSKLLDAIKKLGFEKPTPIQAQALPVIMSGRDCIGVAKTGSGKTLAFVLPMLRHVKDQPPVVHGDGPVALVVAPTRELVAQIYSDIRKLSKPLGIRCVAVYGGSGVAHQISALKRGAEIVVCTPGRMIDILCTGSGNATNLRRVTFLVMDEADRMFDLGFEPQITRIVQNIRPDRQTVLFSATFPRQVEMLARKVLKRLVEVVVGGRSVANRDVAQQVEVRPEGERFPRLLELLGKWFSAGKKILVFVHTQDKCDSLLRDLLRHGYPCMSLHGGKEQTDRESTIADFKGSVCDLLVATSVAARGLDVRELELVVNYDVPNHYEEYVHRVGRTGRAGRKGSAVTFVSQEEERYAPDLVRALELSGQTVPDDVRAMADRFMAKVKQGTEQAHGTGYGGSGFKFNVEEEARRSAWKAQAREHGYEVPESESDSDAEDEEVARQDGRVPAPVNTNQQSSDGTLCALRADMEQSVARMLLQARAAPEHHEAELEINDFPQNARWKITRRETLAAIQEWTGAAITTRGVYVPHGKVAGANERKLYLRIEGPTELDVKKAKAELKRILEDCASQALNLPTSAQTGRYSVL